MFGPGLPGALTGCGKTISNLVPMDSERQLGEWKNNGMLKKAIQ